jgi:hypothetical protein
LIWVYQRSEVGLQRCNRIHGGKKKGHRNLFHWITHAVGFNLTGINPITTRPQISIANPSTTCIIRNSEPRPLNN